MRKTVALVLAILAGSGPAIAQFTQTPGIFPCAGNAVVDAALKGWVKMADGDSLESAGGWRGEVWLNMKENRWTIVQRMTGRDFACFILGGTDFRPSKKGEGA